MLIEADDTFESQRRELDALLRRGMDPREAEAAVGIRVGEMGRVDRPIHWLPMPSEIRERAALIRRGWADGIELTRGGRGRQWDE